MIEYNKQAMNSLDKKLPLNNKKNAMKKYITGFRDIKNIKHCSNIGLQFIEVIALIFILSIKNFP